MSKTLVEEYIKKPASRRVFLREQALLQLSELFESVTQSKGIKSSELSKFNKAVLKAVSQLADLGLEFRIQAGTITK